MAGYELVLQFRGPKVETEDEIVEIEDALFEVLEHGESWTGHDVRAAARNIVVETPDAQATFDDVVVGARPLAGTDFVTLWPPGGEPFDHR